MGFFSSLFGAFGFVFGLCLGLVIGYFLFIYWQPADVKDPVIRPLGELDSKTLQNLLPEIPLWVKNPDYDRVDWMNKFIRDLWPYLDKAICKIIRDTTKPIINEYCEKFKMDSVEFECLTLGTLPPTIQGVKAFDTQESEMMIELPLKWAGNPNILVVVKAFGLKATIQLVDLQVFSIARLTFKPLVPNFPCFSKVIFSVMEKPHIDFGLKLLGGDVMAIPGLYGFLQDLIKEEVANLYLWPKTLEIAILDDSKLAVKKPVGMLHVKVLNGRNLRRADFMGKSDPYVRISLGGGTPSKKTQVKKNTLNPDWNESFNLVVHDPHSQVLEFHVYDWEKVSSHDFLGMQILPLATLTPDEPKPLTLDLRKNMDDNDDSNKKSRGQISVEVWYRPFKEEEENLVEEEQEKEKDEAEHGGGLLVITVHKGQDLEGRYHTNPYAKIVYRGQEYKTKPLKKMHDPKWSDGRFEITCDEPPLNEKIIIEIMSKSMGIGLHWKEMLGYVEINLADVVRNKRIIDEYVLTDSRNGKVQVELEWLPG